MQVGSLTPTLSMRSTSSSIVFCKAKGKGVLGMGHYTQWGVNVVNGHMGGPMESQEHVPVTLNKVGSWILWSGVRDR